ncbi:MAG: indolepyruvate ferredoxin oxidoreductase family protein, partial [bacterium]
MDLANISLDDKYEQESGPIYLTGSQALIRLAINQYRRDKAAGLDTACFITGYRGSPVHNVDKELYRAQRLLADGYIHFRPGVNEDLAATSCWGTQQAATKPGARKDGVFAMWYGKGPGLDRSIDAIRHANLAGTSAHGGVLAVVGDDPAMKSTDVPAASETMFADLFMPMLYPATVQEILDYGLYGWELSRFTGAWVGFKVVADTIDTAAVVESDPHRLEIVRPNFEFPADGVSIRAGDSWKVYESRLREYKIPAALAFGRANNLNRRIIDGPRRRFGIISSGKAAMDTWEALRELGLDAQTAAETGITFLKIGMPFPFDGETIRDFSEGLDEILVVEEKRPYLESQVRDALYNLPDGRRPRVTGQHDETGGIQFPETGEFGPADVARVLARRIAYFHTSERVATRMAFLEKKSSGTGPEEELSISRIPYFCSGCPHNSSTKVPEGSRGQGGVGCHFMATYMERNTDHHTHMGAEGANWIGQAPFTEVPHVFQNMGDGTYYHSGLLAIRACVAAGVNITYKILFNDAVAM